MHRYARTLFPLSPEEHRWRALALYAGIVLFLVARLPLLLPDVFDRTAEQTGWDTTLLLIVQVALATGAASAYYLVRQGRVTEATLVLAGGLLAEALIYLLGDSWDASRGLAELWIGVALVGLMLPLRINGLVAMGVFVALSVGALREFGSLKSDDQIWRVAAYLTLVVWTGALQGLSYLAAHTAWRAARPRSHRDPSQQLMALSDCVAQGLFARTDLEELLGQITATIAGQFDAIYHVQIYLVDPACEQAVLRAATGTVGRQLLAQEYACEVGGLSVVGRVTISGEPLFINDYHTASIHQPQVLLPETRSELAIPLVVEGQVIGVLDVQSKRPVAFDETDRAVLRSIAEQVAVAVDSLQLYESAQRSLRENQALYQQTQASLREIERLNYQLTGRAWSEYLRLHTDTAAMTLDLATGHATMDAEWTATLEEAARHNQVITTVVQGRRVVALPIVVRNEVIGAVEFELESADELPEGALELVAAVGQRLGLAMENRRLFEETQRAAQREALINDIGADLQAASGVDAIIQRAAHHLQESLDAQQVTIRISDSQPEQEKTGP